MFSIAPELGDDELRIDIAVVLADDEAGIGLAPAVHLASRKIAVVEAVHPHLRDRQRVGRFREGNAAAGVGVAGEQRLESGLRQLGLEIARHLQDRGAGIGAIGDAGDAAFQPPRVGGLAVLEGGPLHPRRIKILHLISRDDAAAEAADAGIIFCADHVARLRGGVRHRAKRQGEQQEDRPEQCAR